MQKDLKLTAEQLLRLGPLVEALRKPRKGDGLSAAEQEVLALLQPDQAARLTQLGRQARGPQALLDPETARLLGLTDNQKETLATLLARPGRDSGRRGPPRSRPGPWGSPSSDADGKAITEQALQVLDARQRAQWQVLLGEPFRGDLRPGPPRFGPPGFGH